MPDRGPQLWERLSGPRHSMGPGGSSQGANWRGPRLAGAAALPREQVRQIGGTYAQDSRGGRSGPLAGRFLRRQ
jgi:hypothetical protein